MEKTIGLSYEDIVENLSTGIVAVDRGLMVAAFNQTAERMTEMSRGEALGRPVKEVFRSDDWFVRAVEETLSKDRVTSGLEGRLHRRLSPPLHVSITTARITGRTGRVEGAVAMIYDLTAGIKSLDSAPAGEDISKLGRFTADLIHEIKNPLGGIRGAAQLLWKKTDNEKLREYAEVIVREADRLDSLLREMAGFTGPTVLRKGPVNIHRVLDSVLLIAGQGLPRGVKIRKEYDPSLPPVAGDEARLAQAFLNLVKNAGEAISGEGLIRVVTRMVPGVHRSGEKGPARMAAVDIIDTGCGIGEEDLKRIFRPFFTTKKEGSGLGMPITMRIIMEHGGLLKVNSMPGRGTSVSVYLPVYEEKSSKEKGRGE